MNQSILSNDDKPREACGLFGIYDHPEAAKMAYFGLYALQHRGQESAGIAVARDARFFAIRYGARFRCVSMCASGSAERRQRHRPCAVFHHRSSLLSNAQPFVVRHGKNRMRWHTTATSSMPTV